MAPSMAEPGIDRGLVVSPEWPGWLASTAGCTQGYVQLLVASATKVTMRAAHIKVDMKPPAPGLGALTAVTASLGAILAAAIPLWVVLLSGLIGIPCIGRVVGAPRGGVRRHHDRCTDGTGQCDR